MERNDQCTAVEVDVVAGSTRDVDATEVRSFDDVQRELEYALLRAQVSVAAVVSEVLR